MKIRVREATITGSDHKRLGKNNQDSRRFGGIQLDGQKYLFGVVCDGCSGGVHSETGAHLMASYISNEIPAILQLGLPLQDVPQALFTRCIGYLSAVTAQTIVGDALQRTLFVRDQMLCTIMAFVMSEQELIFFSAGDGMYVVNDHHVMIDQDNKPAYLGYHLVDKAYLTVKGGILPQSFSVNSYSTKEVNRFAICTDGMLPEAVDSLWNWPPESEDEHKLVLQRRLRVLANRTFNFKDDCTVIAVEITREEEAGKDDSHEVQEGGDNELQGQA